MKWLFLLIVLAGAGFLFWKFQDEILSAVSGKGSEEVVDGGDEPDKGGGLLPGGSPKGDNNTPATNGPTPEERYPFPTFKPLEQIVGNWQAVPPTAFPREVILKSDVKFELANGAGSTVAKAGGSALALSLVADQLLLAPRVGSTLRGRTTLDQTNFKEVLAGVYEAYKTRKKNEIVKQRARALQIAANAPAPSSSGGGNNRGASSARDVRPSAEKLKAYEAKVGTMPARSSNGTIAIMVNSIKQGDVSEIKLDEITNWGPIQFEEVERKPYWTATVSYATTSLFGTFPTEAMALMRHGKVEQWVYTGSLEEVP
jgi:hypothetical protein